MKIVFVIILAATTICGVVQADTPANCTWNDAHGTWIIKETDRFGGKENIDCTKNVNFTNTLTVTLQSPDLAVDSNGNMGFWTLIYNQGFEIRINGRKYFGFFQWKKDGSKIISYCDRLQNTSTSHDVLSKNWACISVNKQKKQTPKEMLQLNYQILDKQLFKPNYDFVSKINSVQTFWTATHYDEYVDKSHEYMLKRRGGRLSKVQGRVSPAPVNYETQQLVDLLPDSWDWRNAHGQNFVSPIRNQGGCGSCYSFSAMGMLEARVKIMTNNKVNLTLSEQDVVECSRYSQGCDGGFPYLIAGKYAEDFGAAMESCNPYSGSSGQCHTKPGCRRLFATDYQYVGGYYGACNEALMRLELVRNGPMSISFEVYPDFQQYKGGIYHHTGLHDKINPFELTNHAVLLVGYGVEKGVKFWTVKNSWGANWGEHGYFRIVRGTDECAIESMALESFPINP